MDWHHRKAYQGVTGLPRYIHKTCTQISQINNQSNSKLGHWHDANEMENCQQKTPIYEENHAKRP